MDIPDVPKVFFIRGVFKHTARSMQEVIETRPVITEMPPPLLRCYENWNNEEWDQQRAVQCSTCPRQVGFRCAIARQIFIPESIEKCKLGTRWKSHDTSRFCSWPCAQFHILRHLSNDNRFSLLLKHLYKLWMDKTIDEIAAGINPWRCQDLGGDVTLDEYHRLNDFNMQRLQCSFETVDEE